MTDKPKDPAQEVQEPCPVAGADAAIFEEIGYTVPPTEAQTVKREIMDKRYNAFFSGHTEQVTGLTLAEVLELLRIAENRLAKVKAGEDNGGGLKTGLRHITERLTAIKEEPGADLAAVAEAEKKAAELAQEVQEAITEFATLPGLDALQGWSVRPVAPATDPIINAVAGMQTAFNAVAAAQKPAIDLINGINTAVNAISGSGVFDTIGRTVRQVGEWAKQMQERIAEAEKTFTEFLQSEQGERAKKVFSDIGEWGTSNERDTAEMLWLLDFIENIDELLPFAEQELERMHRETGVDSFTLEEFLRDTDPNTGEYVQSLLEICIERANAARAAKEEPGADLPTAKIKRAELIEYPLDKVNGTIWRLLESDTGGQLRLKAEKAGSKKQINILYSIDFEDLAPQGVTITKRLTAFDKRAYIAIAALFNAGNEVITLSQIYYAMGHTGTPSETHLKKINDAVSKMAGAKVYVNNTGEIEAKYHYPKFVYDGALLPIERMQAVVNGQLAEAAIHIFREPPVITFAKQRSQITTIEVKLLQSPISKTDANLLIDDYLIERICTAARRGKRSEKILLSTLYEHAGITTKKQKQRAPEKIGRYLEHYKSCGKITRYTITADAATVYFQ